MTPHPVIIATNDICHQTVIHDGSQQQKNTRENLERQDATEIMSA